MMDPEKAVRGSCLPGFLLMIGIAMLIAYPITAMIQSHVDPSSWSQPSTVQSSGASPSTDYSSILPAVQDDHNFHLRDYVLLGGGCSLILIGGIGAAIQKSKEGGSPPS